MAENGRSRGVLKQLPMLTDEELDILYDVVNEEATRRVGIEQHRWSILNSLRTAIGEARANPIG